jgi:putative Mg2+ transporter-C (MgtC) family protein
MTPELGFADIAIRIAVAALLTGAVGLERELREHAAGLRTHMLVGVGSALFTIVSAYGWQDFTFDRDLGTVLDPTRIAAQIVTGIGFLGAGAIIRQGISIRGLTTAAGLWVAAAIGLAAGAGFYSAAFITTGVVLVGLGPLRLVAGGLPRRMRKGAGLLELTLVANAGLGPVIALVQKRGGKVERVELEEAEERTNVRIAVSLPSVEAGPALVEELARRDDVVAVHLEM